MSVGGEPAQPQEKELDPRYVRTDVHLSLFGKAAPLCLENESVMEREQY